MCVTRKGRAVGVMMSIRQYGLLRGAAWEQLMSSMDALGRESAAAGLTEAGSYVSSQSRAVYLARVRAVAEWVGIAGARLRCRDPDDDKVLEWC